MTNRLEENGSVQELEVPPPVPAPMQPPAVGASEAIRMLREQQAREFGDGYAELCKRTQMQFRPVVTFRGGKIEESLEVVPVN